LQPFGRRERQRRGDLFVVGMIGARQAEGQLEPAGSDQRPRARKRWRDAAALVAGDLVLRDAGAGRQLAVREPG
jgi:hypothetical protein